MNRADFQDFIKEPSSMCGAWEDRKEIYGQPDFYKRVGVDVNWACANLSGVVMGTRCPPHDESRAGQTS
jgi:hypothetical protein